MSSSEERKNDGEVVAKLLCQEKSMILRPFESGSKAATVHSTRPTSCRLGEENGLEWPQKGDFNGQMSCATTSGVIVGCDDTLEWMLTWWWDHYSATNSHPVAFIDFGMTEEAKAWCKERGQLIRLEMADVFVKEKEAIDASHIQAWENLYGKQFWVHRTGWFKKPLACLLTPFNRTIWIDLDCEVRGSLNKLFEMADHPSGIAMAADIHAGYNSGVVIFKKDLPLIQAWAKEAVNANHLYAGDQDIVSKIIAEQKLAIAELSPLYNWSRIKGDSKDAIIYHWHGRHGKAVIAMLNWLKI